MSREQLMIGSDLFINTVERINDAQENGLTLKGAVNQIFGQLGGDPTVFVRTDKESRSVWAEEIQSWINTHME